MIFKVDAEKQYIDLINELIGKEKPAAQSDRQSNSSTYKEIITSIEHNNVYKIVLNRPKKYNAITRLVKI